MEEGAGLRTSPQGEAHKAASSIQCPGCHLAPLATQGPLPRTGGLSAGTEPVMWLLGITQDSIPSEDPVTPARVRQL